MIFHIVEEIIEYPVSLLEAWKNGEKSWVPEDLIDTDRGWRHIENQPGSLFGEIFTLTQKRREGWLGFNFYLISTTCEPTNEKYFTGKRKIEELIPSNQLAQLRKVTAENGLGEDQGLPDLFLFNANRDIQFLEVKKETDTIKDHQLAYLSIIKSIIQCHVGIVYLIEQGRLYKPKTYCIDTNLYKGWQV